MNKIMLIKIFLLLITCTFFYSCSEPNSPIDSRWISLGLKGGNITSIKITKTYVYACVDYKGLFRHPISSLSDDWEYIGLKYTTLINGIDTSKGITGPNTEGIIDVIIDPNNENEILAGIITTKPNVPGIYKTTDGGKNWFEADSGYGFIPYWWPDDSGRFYPQKSAQVLFSPANQFDIIFAGDCWNDGIYKSTDSGLTWYAVVKPALNAFSQVNTYFQDPVTPNIIYAGGSSSPSDASVLRPAWLMKSYDYGETWHTIIPTLQDSYFNSIVDDICITTNPRAIYLGMRGFLFGSKDEGKTWRKLIIDSEHPGQIFSIEASPKDENHLIAGNALVFYESLDAGNTWAELKSPVNGRVYGFKWDNSTDNLYCATTDSIGVYVLPNASSFHLSDMQ
jgi:photosystem II stability/assembly factor-like uncharacterized protein